MDMDRLMGMLKTMIDDYQAKADANHKTMLAEIKADREMLAAIRANHEKRMAMIRAWRQTDTKNNEEEAMACEEKTEVRLEEEEPTSVEMKPEVADEQEVPVQDAEVVPVGEPGKKRRDRRLAAKRRQKEKDQNLDARRRRKGQERAQRKNGCRKTTRRAAMARRRILPTKDTNRELHKDLMETKASLPCSQ
jgi:hypothetical protein